MSVFALWSAPRARSTAFFRAMVQRGDLLGLHEPFCALATFGVVDVDGHRFTSAHALLAWLRSRREPPVFLKDTTDHRYAEVLADRDFLVTARHAFLIRRPDEIAASFFAVQPRMTDNSIGLAGLHELYRAVEAAGGNPVVLDSDDLVDRPEATMAAYCAAVGLPFDPRTLHWASGERPEWQRSARWHGAASDSTGFRRRAQAYEHTVETSTHLAELADRHRPYYDALHAARLRVR